MDFVYNPDCKRLHSQPSESCVDCHQSVCSDCRAVLQSRVFCRDCTAATRDSPEMVDVFEEWLGRLPQTDDIRLDVAKHPHGAVARIEGRRFVGQVTIWRNGCCDVEFISSATEADRQFIHRVLVDADEVRTLLNDAYRLFGRLEKAG